MTTRLQALVDALALHADDDVLEIGCGHGVAATLVCEQLAPGDGRLTAIDRSPKMVEAAARRNAMYVEAGKAEFLEQHLERLDLGDRRFDVVFAVRVGLFHRDPQRARALVEPWFKPTTRLHAFFDPPARRPTRSARRRL